LCRKRIPAPLRSDRKAINHSDLGLVVALYATLRPICSNHNSKIAESVGPRPGTLGVQAQLFTYGWPSAAGARTRPTRPATAMMVAMYGSMLRNWLGTGLPTALR
jgi:hypothetical protein